MTQSDSLVTVKSLSASRRLTKMEPYNRNHSLCVCRDTKPLNAPTWAVAYEKKKNNKTIKHLQKHWEYMLLIAGSCIPWKLCMKIVSSLSQSSGAVLMFTLCWRVFAPYMSLRLNQWCQFGMGFPVSLINYPWVVFAKPAWKYHGSHTSNGIVITSIYTLATTQSTLTMI